MKIENILENYVFKENPDLRRKTLESAFYKKEMNAHKLRVYERDCRNLIHALMNSRVFLSGAEIKFNFIVTEDGLGYELESIERNPNKENIHLVYKKFIRELEDNKLGKEDIERMSNFKSEKDIIEHYTRNVRSERYLSQYLNDVYKNRPLFLLKTLGLFRKCYFLQTNREKISRGLLFYFEYTTPQNKHYPKEYVFDARYSAMSATIASIKSSVKYCITTMCASSPKSG